LAASASPDIRDSLPQPRKARSHLRTVANPVHKPRWDNPSNLAASANPDIQDNLPRPHKACSRLQTVAGSGLMDAGQHQRNPSLLTTPPALFRTEIAGASIFVTKTLTVRRW
jgi:hypothetical protein